MRATRAQPVQMKPLKQYVMIIEQSWSTPIGNKMIIFKESPTISPTAALNLISPIDRGAMASIGDYYEANKDMCCNH